MIEFKEYSLGHGFFRLIGVDKDTRKLIYEITYKVEINLR